MTANSAAQGLARARREMPDAILLDVVMPDLDGLCTLDALRSSEDLRGIPLVFLTAKAQAAEQRQLAGRGALGVLAKPFDPLTLSEEVARILGWSLAGLPDCKPVAESGLRSF